MSEIHHQLCLASASIVRARLLRAAGGDFVTDPADIDEACVKNTYKPYPDKPPLAAALAEQKALHVTARWPHSLVLGADQTLVCDGQAFDKPDNLEAAREMLSYLRGRRHTSTAAVCVVRDQETLWQYHAEATLEMRAFSDRFLDEYLAQAGERELSGVGAYRLEDKGVQLFSAVEGDYFTILGLPLIPVLNFMRCEGVMAT